MRIARVFVVLLALGCEEGGVPRADKVTDLSGVVGLEGCTMSKVSYPMRPNGPRTSITVVRCRAVDTVTTAYRVGKRTDTTVMVEPPAAPLAPQAAPGCRCAPAPSAAGTGPCVLDEACREAARHCR